MHTRRRRPARVRALTAEQFHAVLPAAFGIFAEAMGYPEAFIAPRIRLAQTQLNYPDLRAFGAFHRNRLVGFAYGYRVLDGQWWGAEVARALTLPDADASREWLEDAFELCEIHVSPAWQGAGVGRALLREITAAQPCSIMVLSTPTGPTKAAALYADEGYRPLVSRFRFSGDPRDFEILGKVVASG
ncbi:MAG: GNAT family N-acetyltransferase [Cumulibacter sp.]